MKAAIKNAMFYVLIIDSDRDDQMRLRRALNKNISQILIESCYDEVETVSYFENCSFSPHLIFLDMKMQSVFLKLTMYLIRSTEQTMNTPVVIVNTNQDLKNIAALKRLGVNEFYMEVSRKVELRYIAHDVKNRWLT